MDSWEAGLAIRGVDGALGHLFRIAQQNFRARLAEVVDAENLTLAHYVALSAFESVDEISSADLARLLDVTPQASNMIAHRLLELRLLLRRPEAPGRARMLRLSHRGRVLLGRLAPAVREVEDRAFSGLTGREQLVVRRWLSGLATWSSSVDEPAPPSRAMGLRSAGDRSDGTRVAGPSGLSIRRVP